MPLSRCARRRQPLLPLLRHLLLRSLPHHGRDANPARFPSRQAGPLLLYHSMSMTVKAANVRYCGFSVVVSVWIQLLPHALLRTTVPASSCPYCYSLLPLQIACGNCSSMLQVTVRLVQPQGGNGLVRGAPIGSAGEGGGGEGGAAPGGLQQQYGGGGGGGDGEGFGPPPTPQSNRQLPRGGATAMRCWEQRSPPPSA